MDSWRFTSCGVTREVTVVDTGRTGVQRYAVERGTAQFPGACPEDAVVQYTRCAGFLDLREVVPPGAPTRDEIRRERDAWAHRAEQAEAQAAALEVRVAALEAILAGRTTPPTPDEIAALAAEDGEWGLMWATRAESVPAQCAAQALALAKTRDAREGKYLWRALDAQRRHRAWPVAQERRAVEPSEQVAHHTEIDR